MNDFIVVDKESDRAAVVTSNKRPIDLASHAAFLQSTRASRGAELGDSELLCSG